MPSTSDSTAPPDAGDSGETPPTQSVDSAGGVTLSRRQLLGRGGAAIGLGGLGGYLLGARPFRSPECDGSPISVEADEWSFPNYDRRHTSAAPARAAPDSLDERWRLDWDLFRYGTPAVANDRVFVPVETDLGSSLSALDLLTGRELWRKRFPEVREAHPTVAAGDTVYYHTNTDDRGRTALALSMSDGRERWASSIENLHGFAAPLVPSSGFAILDDGTVGRGASRFYALDVRTGEQCWSTRLDEDGFSPVPAASDGRVYFASRGSSNDDKRTPGSLIALDPSTGEQTWRTEIPYGVDGPPVLGDDVVYLTMFNGPLVAVSRHTGDVVWRDEQTELFGSGEAGREYAQPSYELGALTPDALVTRLEAYTEANDRLRAFDPETGELLWERVAAGADARFTPPTAAGGDVFAAENRDDASGRLLRLDARTGVVEETVSFDSWAHHSPVFADGSAVFVTGNGMRVFGP